MIIHSQARREVISVLPVVLNIVQKDDQFLFIQEAKEACRGTWHLPGGALDPGESLEEGAKRETLEESGIEIEPTGVMCFHRVIPDHGQYNERWRFIVASKAVGGDLKDYEDEESLQASWFTRAQIGELDLRREFTLKLIDQFLQCDSFLPVADFSLLEDVD